MSCLREQPSRQRLYWHVRCAHETTLSLLSPLSAVTKRRPIHWSTLPRYYLKSGQLYSNYTEPLLLQFSKRISSRATVLPLLLPQLLRQTPPTHRGTKHVINVGFVRHDNEDGPRMWLKFQVSAGGSFGFCLQRKSRDSTR